MDLFAIKVLNESIDPPLHTTQNLWFDSRSFLSENCRQPAAATSTESCLLLKIYNSITRKEKLICDLSECGWVIFTIITCPNSKKNLVYILDFQHFFRISCSPLINHSSCNVLLLRLHKSLKYFLLFWMEIFNILNIFSTLKYLILMKVFVYKKTPLRNFHR